MEPIFTLEQIKTARQKVKTGADFPKYIQEIRQLGVQAYETFVVDSHTVYLGKGNQKVVSTALYAPLTLADKTDKNRFLQGLKAHQRGETDYLAFCRDCADTGVARWRVSITAMTCTYYTKEGEVLLVEEIPG